MVIKVLSKTPPKEVLKTVTCSKCGWKHQYAPSDVHKDYSTDMSGCTEAWWYIRCHNPQCLPERGHGFTGSDPCLPGMTRKTNYIEVKRPD